MVSIKDKLRWYLPLICTLGFTCIVSHRIVKCHISPTVGDNRYSMESDLVPRRGSIFCQNKSAAESIPLWRYHLDPAAMSSRRRTSLDNVKIIAEILGLDREDVYKKSLKRSGPGWRHQFLAESDDSNVYSKLSNRKDVDGVSIDRLEKRRYINGRFLSHVIGSVNAEGVGSCGIEQRYNKNLKGVPGKIEGKKDARGREIHDKRETYVPAVPGDSVHLTVDANIQNAVEKAMRRGMVEFNASSGWCIILDVKTAAVLAMVSLPDFDPVSFGKATDFQKINRAVAYNYEPGSVMKSVTAAIAIETGKCTPMSKFSTDRYDERYYKLPGDGGKKWPDTMSLTDAIKKSSNIVMGKVGFDLGPRVMYEYLKKFGFGDKTGIELPGEQHGILRNWQRLDKAGWSRVPIGQGVSVTAIQMAGAFQTIANDGVRMRPHIVECVKSHDGRVLQKSTDIPIGNVIKSSTASKVREMMLGVSAVGGTARRARVKGYSVAGKTGTAQKVVNGRYAPGLYCATYCGIIPSGVPNKTDDGSVYQTDPEVVVLVSLDFDTRQALHQGGNTSAVVFRHIATWLMRHLHVEPDRPDELIDEPNIEDEWIN